MTPKISILIPSIRFQLLEGVYKSIEKSFSQEWELIIASPFPLPSELRDKTNITLIKDDGTPIRGRQRALLAATGDFVCYAADDVTFFPNSLDKAYETLKDADYKTLVVGKYLEGKIDNPFMSGDAYWTLYTHDLLKPMIPVEKRHYLLINTGLISRQLMLEIGGFDCGFEACAISCVDLSIRLQNYGAKCILQNEPIFHCTHLPGGQGDHYPIDRAQVVCDQPRLLSMYISNFNRTRINLENWRDAPDYWVRRWGKREA